MVAVTLDTNCLIDLEEQRPAAKAIGEMIAQHRRNEITLQVCAISASERQRIPNSEPVFEDFKERLVLLGLDQCKILAPIFYWSVTYWDYCLWADEGMRQLDEKIHAILFPNVEYDYTAFCAARNLDSSEKHLTNRWLNAKCDVLALWSHIYHGGNIFVTSDENFHKSKLPNLIQLGAGAILKPNEAAALIHSTVPQRTGPDASPHHA